MPTVTGSCGKNLKVREDPLGRAKPKTQSAKPPTPNKPQDQNPNGKGRGKVTLLRALGAQEPRWPDANDRHGVSAGW